MSQQHPAVVEAKGVVFGFAKQRVLFQDLCFVVPPGVTWVGGDESTGKTTLLRLLAGELRPQSGHLQMDRVLSNGPVFWVDPRTDVFDALTPQAYWEGLRRTYPALDDALLAELTEALALADHLPKSLYMLSTGTKRKVFLAAAFASGAALTLLDEPFAALDKPSIALVLELLQEAATHPSRAWVVADYEPPRGVALASTIAL